MTDPTYLQSNNLCNLLGIQIPILQAPTASIAGPELALAVSEAGALGGMGLTWTDAETAAAHVRWIRERTGQPFFVNFALAFEPSALVAALEAGAPIVSFSWGDPAPYVGLVKSFGAKVGLQVGNSAAVPLAVAQGVDFIICQGIEAGGHVQSSTALDELIRAAVDLAEGAPIVAAGGLATGADIARVLNAGADGAMLGSRFVATVESRAHPEYKRKLVAATADSTALTVCFDGGWTHAPHRVLRNKTLERWEAAGCPMPGCRPGEGEIAGQSASGEPILRYEDTAPREGMTGDIAEMALYAGEGAGKIDDLPGAGLLVTRLWDEARRFLEPECAGRT